MSPRACRGRGPRRGARRLAPAGAALAAALAGALAACVPAFEMREAGRGTRCPGDAASTATRADGGGADVGDVRWYRSTGDRDRRLGGAWCTLVGDPVVRPDPSPSLPAEGDELVVMGWNTNVGAADLPAFLREELDLSCGPGGPAPGPGFVPFVLLVQEAFRYSEDLPPAADGDPVPWTIDPDPPPGGHLAVDVLAERCGLALVYVPSSRNGPDTDSRPHEDRGNAVLSSLSLDAPVAIDLPYEGGRKVAVSARVRTPAGARIRVVSAHLDVASTLFRTLSTGNQTRARQVSGLVLALDRLDAAGPDAAATLVGADLNVWSTEEAAFRIMLRAFPDSPAWDGLGTRGAFPPDHVFYRKNGPGAPEIRSYGRIDPPYHSDHQARRIVLGG